MFYLQPRRLLLAGGAAMLLSLPSFAHAQVTVREFPVDRSVVDIDNSFSRLNPFYKQGAGAFYDFKYVAPSAESLIKIAQVRPEQMPGLLDSLRAFVYEWLDAYVRGNGSMSRTDLEQCIARLDQRFDLLLDSPLQRKLYRVWRDDESNQLGFLMLFSNTRVDAASAAKRAECEGFQLTATGAARAERVPYPPVGKPWPMDLAAATIAKDSEVAHPSSGLFFLPASISDVRAALLRYHVVPKMDWEHSYSHVEGADEGGWLVAGKQCFAWTMRPGGLGWVVYPDGTAVYLAAESRR